VNERKINNNNEKRDKNTKIKLSIFPPSHVLNDVDLLVSAINLAKFKDLCVFRQNSHFNDKKIFSFILGEVELENLPLKKDALSHFGLPIKAFSGSIGKIKLQVPVRQFRTAPWCINIEKVYIICGPVNLEEVRKIFNVTIYQKIIKLEF
jgi:N-terminal region of Chorein or VPS13